MVQPNVLKTDQFKNINLSDVVDDIMNKLGMDENYDNGQMKQKVLSNLEYSIPQLLAGKNLDSLKSPVLINQTVDEIINVINDTLNPPSAPPLESYVPLDTGPRAPDTGPRPSAPRYESIVDLHSLWRTSYAKLPQINSPPVSDPKANLGATAPLRREESIANIELNNREQMNILHQENSNLKRELQLQKQRLDLMKNQNVQHQQDKQRLQEYLRQKNDATRGTRRKSRRKTRAPKGSRKRNTRKSRRKTRSPKSSKKKNSRT